MNRPSYADNMDFTNENPIPTTQSLKIEEGAYIVKFIKVDDMPQYNSLKVYFDIVKGQYAGIFSNNANRDINQWNLKGTMLVSYENQSQFQAFITSVIKSNSNFVWDWNEKNLEGRYAVAVYGKAEFKGSDGTIGVTVKPRFFRSIDALNKGEIEIPQIKKYKEKNQDNQPQQTGFKTFGNQQPSVINNKTPLSSIHTGVEIDDDDLPF